MDDAKCRAVYTYLELGRIGPVVVLEDFEGDPNLGLHKQQEKFSNTIPSASLPVVNIQVRRHDRLNSFGDNSL